MLHLYESHLGGLSWSDEEYEAKHLYCESCGDFDTYIGPANTYREAVCLLETQEDIYTDEHIFELADEANKHFNSIGR